MVIVMRDTSRASHSTPWNERPFISSGFLDAPTKLCLRHGKMRAPAQPDHDCGTEEQTEEQTKRHSNSGRPRGTRPTLALQFPQVSKEADDGGNSCMAVRVSERVRVES